MDPCCTLHARRLWHSVNKAANRQKTLSVCNKVCRNLADDPYFPVHGKKPFFVAFSTKAVQCTPTPLVCHCRLLEITLGAVSVPISSLSPYFSAFLLLCALNPAREYGEHCKLFKQLARTELGRQSILGAFRQWNYPPFLTYKLAQFCFTLWIVRINQIASVDVQNWAYLLNVFFWGGGVVIIVPMILKRCYRLMPRHTTDTSRQCRSAVSVSLCVYVGHYIWNGIPDGNGNPTGNPLIWE